MTNALICKQMDGYHLIVGKNPAPLMFQFSIVVQKVKAGGASALNSKRRSWSEIAVCNGHCHWVLEYRTGRMNYAHAPHHLLPVVLQRYCTIGRIWYQYLVLSTIVPWYKYYSRKRH